MISNKSKRICFNGHPFNKTSDCPTCPICEAIKKTTSEFQSISAPARRALEAAQIHTLDDLSAWTEKDLLALHGFGPSSLPKLKKQLAEFGLNLAEE